MLETWSDLTLELKNRGVTVNDYNSIIRTTASTIWWPGEVAITEENNKIKIKMLSYDTNGTLSNVVSPRC
jgi:hypothetical protein